MRKLVNLKDIETDEIVGSIVLLSIDWYNDLDDAWHFFSDNIGGSIDDFVDWVNNNDEYNIKLDYGK